MSDNSNIELIFSKGSDLETNNFVPTLNFETRELKDILPQKYQRTDLDLPNISEATVVEHFVGLSRNNYGVDNGIYPLGSCTMKYNPKINELTSRLPGFAQLHPLQNENEGALELIYNLGSG